MARVITKGQLGQEDCNFYDGTATFSRATSTGGAQSITKLSGGCKLAAVADATAQGANITGTTLITPTASKLYRVQGYAAVTRAASSSSTLPSIVIGWTDADSNQAMTYVLTPLDSDNALTSMQPGSLMINAKTGVAITYSTSGFASSGGTSMQYAVHLRLEGPL